MFTLAPYLQKKKSQIEKVNKKDLQDYTKMKKAVTCSCPVYKGALPKPVKKQKKIIYK